MACHPKRIKSTSQVLGRNEVEQQTQCIIIFNKVFENLPLVVAVQVLLADIDLVGLHVNSPGDLLLGPHILHALLEGVDQLLARLGLMVLFDQLLLDLLLLLVFNLLLGDFLFELLDLIKSGDQGLFEVRFDIVGYYLHTMVFVVIFAHVQLILYKIYHFLVEILAVFGISGSSSFNEWPVKLFLESK